MRSEEIRQKFLNFFEKRGHAIIPSASLVPENDPSVLFTTAGMHPLVPYLMGQTHPAGKRLANIQKCVRTQDIEDVGDETHDTFFEMMGNWSLGDYFKEDAIKWSYELLTSSEGFGLDPKRLYVTVFAGDENAPRDEESPKVWQSLGIPEHRIYYLPAKNNWWSPGDNGPCGPDTEMFYDLTPEGLGDLSHEEFLAADEKKQVVEIWNDVFMEYEKKDRKVIGKLSQKNVDTGAGLERFCMVLQGKSNVFDTDLFQPLMEEINKLSQNDDLRAKRIVADHIRTAVFMIADGVLPSNTDRGYVLRRILRRAVNYSDTLGFKADSLTQDLIDPVINKYSPTYSVLETKKEEIKSVIFQEENKFRKTLEKGLKQFENFTTPTLGETVIGESPEDNRVLTGKDAFDLYQNHGLPIEIILEKAKNDGVKIVQIDDFYSLLKKHQEQSRVGAEQKFKGGLAGTSEQIVKYHTATHLLHQALRDVLGPEVSQKGSNITEERLRFDFAYPAKMTDEQKAEVEKIVNEKIQASLPVNLVTLPKEEAEKTGALHFFGDLPAQAGKYGDQVNVYYIGENLDSAYSKEFCGGPHVKNTGELGHFKIAKEEAVAAGIRRIKAVLE